MHWSELQLLCRAANICVTNIMVKQINQTHVLRKSLVDEWQDTTTRNGGFDQGVEFLISSDSKLQMAGGDALYAKILGCITLIVHSMRRGGKSMHRLGLPASSNTSAVRYSRIALV